LLCCSDINTTESKYLNFLFEQHVAV
jgi:hypothetical protein